MSFFIVKKHGPQFKGTLLLHHVHSPKSGPSHTNGTLQWQPVAPRCHVQIGLKIATAEMELSKENKQMVFEVHRV